ncbi:MAG: glycosyltransferase family 2 protein [Paracoccaceae bacterium]
MSRKFLFSCMRNEAPYVLEWVAYHRLIGFDHIVVCTNDCDDNTPALLDAIAELGWLTHIRNPVPDGVAAQLHAASRIGERLPWRDGDWVMWLDIDEFLNIHLGQGQVDDLIGRLNGADGFAVHWKIFGSNGQEHWQDALVIERFTRAASTDHQLHEPVKTLFRWSSSIESLHTHRPTLRPSFRECRKHWLHGRGIQIPEAFYYTRLYKDAAPALRLPLVDGVHEWAQVNHYATRSRSEFLRKAKRGSGLYDQRYTQEYWDIYDKNSTSDASLMKYTESVFSSLRNFYEKSSIHLQSTISNENAI